MNYSNFAARAIAQDKRNVFEKYSDNLDIVPNEMRSFYTEFNPVDVEIDYNGVGVRFCPAKELVDLQAEYAYLGVQFVFATCNGDPIFFSGGKIYTCPHGVRKPKWELLAENTETYFKLLA